MLVSRTNQVGYLQLDLNLKEQHYVPESSKWNYVKIHKEDDGSSLKFPNLLYIMHFKFII